jgi:hypothetical protein
MFSWKAPRFAKSPRGGDSSSLSLRRKARKDVD